MTRVFDPVRWVAVRLQNRRSASSATVATFVSITNVIGHVTNLPDGSALWNRRLLELIPANLGGQDFSPGTTSRYAGWLSGQTRSGRGQRGHVRATVASPS